ncbi:hypothetical protein [Sphingomonas sp. MMS24-J13]|uniref:hypothetical protein n=1 Tax=Sphingomonas sp. MMS24-J13 TaxID=3238686 RepID=UPI0038508DB9
MIRLLGGILLAVGMLVAGTSGLCSLFFLISMIGQHGAPDGVLMVLILGGVPFAIGSGLSWIGWKLMKSNRDD